MSKGHQILINRGFQIQGMVVNYDNFSLETYSNANYTSINWLWESNPSLHGPAPGFPWGRWVGSETNMPGMPGHTSEIPYTNQLVTLQLADEWNLNDDTMRTRAVNWFNSVSNAWPNTILANNNWGGQISDGNLIDFVSRARPDMIVFDTYPWKSTYDINQPDHIGTPIGGPPTVWYTHLRVYRDISRAFGIPFGCYVQTFHAVEEYSPFNVYRSPSPSELRLNHFGALTFGAKTLIDFVYNNGSSSLFTPPGGDDNPTALYYEKADCALRVRNFGKTMVRLKPIDEATASWTTSVVFIRGQDSNGNLNAIPINFYAGPGNANPVTDWVYQRNDPYLTNNWVITNKGNRNNGYPGDVIISWFKPLDESFDGPGYTNEVYMMVVNGLTDITGDGPDCLQEIQLNFAGSVLAVEMMNPLTGLVEVQTLPLTNGFRRLTLNLNGGDAALFKFPDGAPFVGTDVVGPPVIAKDPVNQTNVAGANATFLAQASGARPLSFQWLFDGAPIASATTNSFTRTNVQFADAGDYRLVVTNASGSVTSAVATLTVNSTLLILYEPFDYSNIGGPVSSNTPANWHYGGTGANDLSVVSGNLSYPGLATPVGNSVTNGAAGLGVRRLFGTEITSGTLFFSALFKINNPGFGTWSGAAAQAGAFTAPDSTSFRLQVMVKSNSPNGYVIGVQKGGAGATATFGSTEFHAGDTVFLVGRYDFTSSPNSASLWINPISATFGAGAPPAAGLVTATTGVDGFSIDRFNIRQNTAASVPAAMQWDELRAGNSWAEVTPISVELVEVTRLGNGSFQFTYTNGSAQAGTVYASTNLLNWAPIGTVTQTSAGKYQFTDGAASSYARRFYQLRVP